MRYAYIYADPSGGVLFQILMPILAALWGAWLIFAARIANAVKRILGLSKITAPENEPPSLPSKSDFLRRR